MAIGICRDCREKMSKNANCCPHCGSTSRPLKSIRYEVEVKYEDKKITCDECGGDGVLFRLDTERQHLVTYEGKIFGFKHSKWSEEGCLTKFVRECDVEKTKRAEEAQSCDMIIIKVVSISRVECNKCKGSGIFEFKIPHKNQRIVMEEF